MVNIELIEINSLLSHSSIDYIDDSTKYKEANQ